MNSHNNPERAPAGGASSVTLMVGAYVAPGVQLEENVTIGPNAVVLASEDEGEAKTILKTGSVIGANATVLAGVTIGVKARVTPGSVVCRSVPPLAIVEGNPARITGYVETSGRQPTGHPRPGATLLATHASRVRGVALHNLRMVSDLRGNLSVGEFEREIPFSPRRYFLVYDVPTAETRGEHAHLRCQQFLVAVKGSVSFVADDGESREEFVLDSPHVGLYIPPMTWGIQYRYSADAVLLVFASEYYNAEDYVRDYADFLQLVQERAQDR